MAKQTEEKKEKKHYAECRICANSGYVIVERDFRITRRDGTRSSNWLETTVRCDCQRGRDSDIHSMTIREASQRDDFRCPKYLDDLLATQFLSAIRATGVSFDGINWRKS